MFESYRERQELEMVARAIYEKRPDCQGKPWPGKTYYPIAAVDLSFVYAKAAIQALVAQRIEQGFSTPEVAGSNPAERAKQELADQSQALGMGYGYASQAAD